LQKVCSVINLFAYYAIGLPSAVTFAFILKIGGKVGSTMFYFYVIMIRYILICVPFMCQGLWLGIICAMAVQIFALVVMMLRTNWNEEVHPTSYATINGMHALCFY